MKIKHIVIEGSEEDITVRATADGAAAIPTRVAAAMVECHLLRSLPSGCRTLVVSGRWQVRDTVHATNTDWFDTPLEALIAFYMEDRKP
jgi:hypothetical protein